MRCEVKAIDNMVLIRCKNVATVCHKIADGFVNVCKKHTQLKPFVSSDNNRRDSE
jgi:hypothetical protein